MNNYIILIDFGHGTRLYTKGKHSPDNTLYEGEWNREVGWMLVNALKELGFDVRVIVPEDEDISLKERCFRANKIIAANPKKKCIFISIHINAAGSDGRWHDASGWSVWVSKNCSQSSKDLARGLYDVAYEYGLKGNRSVPKERYWQADFAVLRGTNCPAVLTENMFQDNKKDCEWLKSKVGKETIVNLHLSALCKYIGVPYAQCQN